MIKLVSSLELAYIMFKITKYSELESIPRGILGLLMVWCVYKIYVLTVDSHNELNNEKGVL